MQAVARFELRRARMCAVNEPVPFQGILVSVLPVSSAVFMPHTDMRLSGVRDRANTVCWCMVPTSTVPALCLDVGSLLLHMQLQKALGCHGRNEGHVGSLFGPYRDIGYRHPKSTGGT
jgi:hypothetical protein